MAAWDWLKWAVSVLLLARLVTELDWRLMGRPAALRVCFLTDVEGNWSYFKQFVLRSKCLRFADTSGHDDAEPQLELQDDCMLVFGGDAGDKGDDTLRCYEQLVQLKQRYPTRVVLLVGNRDVNKMRFTSELADSEMDLATMAKGRKPNCLCMVPISLVIRYVLVVRDLRRTAMGSALQTHDAGQIPCRRDQAHGQSLG